jgi:uncharacterized protein YycO
VDFQPGDILLFRVSSSSNWLDKLIGWGQRVIREAPTNAAYCHVALVGPDGEHLYEAKWPKIHNIPINVNALQKNIILETYRVKGISGPEIRLVMDYARDHVGRHYDVLALLTFGYVQMGRSAVCSQFVWEAFTAAARVLCPYKDLTSPDDIAASPLLEKVA